MTKKIYVMIVEDDPDFTYLLKTTLKKTPDITVCAVCTNAACAIELALKSHPDIVLMDLNLSTSHMDGIGAARQIRIQTDAKILILTSLDDPEIIQTASVRSFASGYVFKHQPDLLIDNIRELAHGHTGQEYLIMSSILSELSPAEKVIFQMMMGEEVNLRSSTKTIANQKTGVLKKLGLKSQKELRHIFEIYKK